MKSQALCPQEDCDGMIPVTLAPAEPEVGISGSYIVDWGGCDLCEYEPAVDDDDTLDQMQEYAVDAYYNQIPDHEF